MTTSAENGRTGGRPAMQTPPLVSPQEWEAARERLLVKEKAETRARDALAAERRRMPWMAVETAYAFEGPAGKASLLDLFDGRRQLIVYRAFFEPGVFGWPDHACRGCSMVADQVAHLAHLNARDTTLVFVSRAPQADIARLKAQMGWEGYRGSPSRTASTPISASASGTARTYSTATGDRVFRTYFINNRGDEQMGAPGTTSTSRLWAGRRSGRTRLRAILRPQPTSGGTGTTTTSKRQRPTRSGSRCRTPERLHSGTKTQTPGHEPDRPPSEWSSNRAAAPSFGAAVRAAISGNCATT